MPSSAIVRVSWSAVTARPTGLSGRVWLIRASAPGVFPMSDEGTHELRPESEGDGTIRHPRSHFRVGIQGWLKIYLKPVHDIELIYSPWYLHDGRYET